jgi:hypothetical protein
MSPSTGPRALSISRSCPIAAPSPPRFLQRFLDGFSLTVHTVLTDNGSEFTDRFAVDKKGRPDDKPSGQHPFDRACAQHAITTA